jgi:cytochrome c551
LSRKGIAAAFAAVFLVPLLVTLFAETVFAESPAPATSPAQAQGGTGQPAGGSGQSGQAQQGGGQGVGGLPGDPNKGMTIYQDKCTSCHGANLEGGVGAKLNPIQGGEQNLKPEYLINVITNGKKGDLGQMPAWKGQIPDQGIRDVAAYIITENKTKGGTLSPAELAKSNVLWVTVGIGGMLVLTWLLARYNMRWVSRRAMMRR